MQGEQFPGIPSSPIVAAAGRSRVVLHVGPVALVRSVRNISRKTRLADRRPAILAIHQALRSSPASCKSDETGGVSNKK
jgi:hypothetical protein